MQQRFLHLSAGALALAVGAGSDEQPVSGRCELDLDIGMYSPKRSRSGLGMVIWPLPDTRMAATPASRLSAMIPPSVAG